MLFNSFFRNVNVTLLGITNTATMLYAACRLKSKVSFREGGGGGGGLGPLLLNFLDLPLKTAHIKLVLSKDYFEHMDLIVNTEIMVAKLFFI